jgi:integrase
MAQIRLKGINRVRKRLADGTVAVYLYHRATGTRLPDDPRSPDFLIAYAEAEKITPKDVGSVAGLIRKYLDSLKFERKRETTKREYRRILTSMEAEFGTMPQRALASPKVRGFFLGYQERIGREHPREADNRLSVLSAVFTYAAAMGEIADNPIRGFERLYHADRANFIWTENDITRFMENAPVELQQALILAIHTGQRYGDLIRLRWADDDGEALTLTQSKTGAKVYVPCSQALRRMLNGMERRGPFILTRADGRPWFTEKNDKALSKAWREHARTVGITELHFHDLRGTAVTLMNEAGVSIQQVAAITGHTMQSATRILEKYGARTRRLAKAAIVGWENAKETRFANQLQTGPVGNRSRGGKDV